MKKRWLEIPELSNKEKLLLFSILLFGFLLRFIGIWKYLPFSVIPDENLLLKETLKFGENFNIGEAVKSAPHSFINFFFCAIYYLTNKITGVFQSPEDMAIKFVREPSDLYFILRTVSSILSTSSILLMAIFIYKVIRKKGAFFWSALLYAILPVSVMIGRTMKEDNTAVPLFLISITYLLTLYEEGGVKRFLIGGFLTGSAVAAKGYAVFLYPVIFLIWLERREKLSVLLLSLLGIIAGNSIINPYPYFNLDRNITLTFLGPLLPLLLEVLGITGAEGSFRYAKVAGGIGGKIGEGVFGIKTAIEDATGWFFILISAIGFFYCLLKRNKDKILHPAFLFIPLYFSSLILYVQCYDKYLLPLIPFLFIVLLIFLYDIKPIYRYFLLGLTAFSLLFISLKKVITQIKEPPTEKRAFEWIMKNIKPGEKILVEIGTLHYLLPETKESVMREYEEYRKFEPYIKGKTFEIRLKFADENGYDIYRIYHYDRELFPDEKVGVDNVEEIKRMFDYVITGDIPQALEKWKRLAEKRPGYKWMIELYSAIEREFQPVVRFPSKGSKLYEGSIVIYRVKKEGN